MFHNMYNSIDCLKCPDAFVLGCITTCLNKHDETFIRFSSSSVKAMEEHFKRLENILGMIKGHEELTPKETKKTL